LTPTNLQLAVEAYRTHKSKQAAADSLGWTRSKMRRHLHRAAERGLMGPAETLPGYAIRQMTSKMPDGTIVQQRKAAGPAYEPLEGMALKGRTTWTNSEGRVTNQVHMERADAQAQLAAMRAAVEGFKDELPRASPVAAPVWSNEDLLCQYTITDAHLGALAWNEETGGGDYDLSIGERLIIDWFTAAIAVSPSAKRAVFAQLGDFLHYDSFKTITPEHGHLLDGDTRYPKMVRAAIRIVRRVIRMLLEKHERVDVIMADANHDPSSEVWLREMLAAFYDDEPRVVVDTTPGTYTMLEHGDVSLFYHHGHRRGIGNVDSVFVGKFREAYGRTRHSYAHIGHKHQDELKNTNLMKVEMHETLAAPDAYAANGGWLSGRSAKVIYYHRKFGFVGNNIMTPEMVLGAAKMQAATDNEPQRRVA
jgi:hypothetical protein